MKIGHREYKLGELSKKKSRCLNGETDLEKATIRLAKGLEPAVRRETLLHEVMHACCHEAGLMLDHDVEEAICTNLARWLVMVLRDNPELAEELVRLGTAPSTPG